MNVIEFVKGWAKRDLTDYEIARLEFLDKCRRDLRTPVLVSASAESKSFLMKAMGAYMNYLDDTNTRGVLLNE